MPHNFARLKEEILKHSVSEDWDSARHEWEPTYSYHHPDETCICGKEHIVEVNILENKYYGTELKVGSTCVKKFKNIDISFVHLNLNKIRRDINARVNERTMAHLLKRNVINQVEYKFYIDVWRKRKLTHKQEWWIREINKKCLAWSNQWMTQPEITEDQKLNKIIEQL
jgi:hypothetical protein